MTSPRTLFWLGLFAGCSSSTIHVGTDPDALTEVATIPTAVNRDLDLLFVVDNSPSMLDKQTAVIASFPKMMDQLASLDGGLPNVHIGVVTSDLGTSDTTGATGPSIPGSAGGCSGHGLAGALQTNGAAVAGPFISDLAGNGMRETNYTGALRDVFTTMASVGAAGCGFEQTLGAVKQALDPANAANAGFLRHDANLAIVIVSDEDDCTASDSRLFTGDSTQLGPLESFRCTRYGVTCDDGGTTVDEMNTVGGKSSCHASPSSNYVAAVQPLVDYVKGLKADPLQVMVAAIVGDPTPVEIELRAPSGSTVPIPALAHSCAYSGTDASSEVADPAVRIAQFTNAFAPRAQVTSVCGADLALPLENIGTRAKELMGDPCIAMPLAHPAAPTCTVTDDLATDLPACDGSNSRDCWKLVTDFTRCQTSPDQLRVQIDRVTTPTAHYTHVRCRVAS